MTGNIGLNMNQGTAEINDKLALILKKIEEQDKRIDLLERVVVAGADHHVSTSALMSAVPPPPPPPPPPPKLGDNGLTESVEKMMVGETSIEQNIGGIWFARIGIAALVLGISFFLKYAFDNDWIGETGRVLIGIFSGLALLACGEKTIRKYFVYGQIMAGGGIVGLYLSLFSAFNYYHLIGQAAAFIFMAVVTVIGIALSIRYGALALILVSIVGGFATPYLVSTGVNNQLALFGYVILLDLAILVVSYFYKWRELNFVGLVGTMITFLVWSMKFYSVDQLMSTMIFLTIFFIIYSLSSLIYNLAKKEKSTGTEQLGTMIAGIAFFAAAYGLLNVDYHVFMGSFTVILAIYYFLWAILVRELTPDDNNLYDFLAFLTIGFITLAIPIQFKENVITLAWIIEAVLLLFLGLKVGQKEIKVFGIVVSLLAGFKCLLDSTEPLVLTDPFFNKTFFTFLTAIAAYYLIAYLFKRFQSTDDKFYSLTIDRRRAIAAFIIFANFLTILSISKEIVRYFDNQKRILAQETTGPANRPAYADAKLYDQKLTVALETIKKIESRSSIALSIFWLAYGILLISIGIVGRYKLVRLGAMLLLSLAILKLFFYDLWSLGTLYRIISSICLGLALLGISFGYNKYRDKIKDLI